MYLEKLTGITTKINIMKNFITTSINKNHLSIMIVVGFALALAFVGFIILSVDNPKPEWSEYWFVKPLLITPIVGAIGGALCYLINTFSFQNSFVKLLRILISIIVLIFFIWIGTVLGLDGTLWN